jgi:pyruvate-formate lyase
MKTTSTTPMYSERIGRIRDHVLKSVYEADIERARYYTKAYRETEGQLPCIQAAKGLEETLRHMSIKIGEDDRLVGAKTIRTIAGPMGIERNASGEDGSEYGMVRRRSSRPKTDDIGQDEYEWRKGMASLTEEEKREFKEDILPFWEGKSATFLVKERWKTKDLPVGTNPFAGVAGAAFMQGHVTIGLKKILDLGW